MQWLRARDPDLPRIQGVAIHDASRVPLAGAWQLRIPRDTQRVIVDTPAGLRAMDLAGRITTDDMLIVPIQPSAIDVRATSDFIRDLLLVARLRPQDRRLAIIGNRTKRGPALQALKGFLENLRIPVLEYLREAGTYGVAAEQGVGVGELPMLQSRLHASAWQNILNGLENGAAPLPASVRVERALPAAPAALPAFLMTPAQPVELSASPAVAAKELN